MFEFERNWEEYTAEERCYLYFKNQDTLEINELKHRHSVIELNSMRRLGYVKYVDGYSDVMAIYELTDKGKECRRDVVNRNLMMTAESAWLHGVFSAADTAVVSIYNLTARQRKVLHAFAVNGYIKADIGAPADDYDTYTLTDKGIRYMASIKYAMQSNT